MRNKSYLRAFDEDAEVSSIWFLGRGGYAGNGFRQKTLSLFDDSPWKRRHDLLKAEKEWRCQFN